MTRAILSTPVGAASIDAGLATSLSAILAGLTTPRRRIEDAFVDIGGRLVEASGILGTITASFETLAGGLEARDATNTFVASETLAQHVLTIIAATPQEARDLSRLVALVTQIHGPVTDLCRAVKSIGLVALSTSIAVTHLTGRRDEFAAFTDDIKRLSERASLTTSNFMAAYKRLVETLKAAEAKRAALEATERRTTSGLRERLERSLRDMADYRQQAGAACEEIGQLFGRIAGSIASTVTALQIGDITRQRIEHIEGALALTLDPAVVLGEVQGGNDNALIAAVCRLQTVLATQAADDFQREVRLVVDTLRRLATDSRDIVVRGRKVHGETIEGSRATLAGLIDEVRRACALAEECEDERRELDQAGSVVSASLDELLRSIEAVQRIKGEMHLLGINMALKCAVLGTEGRDLNVIAFEVRELAGKTVTHAQTVVTALGEASIQAKRLTADAGGGKAEDFAGLNEEISAFAQLSQAADRRMVEALDCLARDGTHVAGQLDKAAGAITIHQEIGGVLRGAVTAIGHLRDNAQAQYAKTGTGDIKHAEELALSRLKGRYAMASERAPHDQVTGSRANARMTPAAARSGEVDLDGIFL